MRLQDAVLHGPQRVQGHFLRFSQSSDARDIEPLVGPVAPQVAQLLATGRWTGLVHGEIGLPVADGQKATFSIAVGVSTVDVTCC